MQISLTRSEFIALQYVSQLLIDDLTKQPQDKDILIMSRLRVNAVIKKYAEEEKRCREKRVMKFRNKIKNIEL